MSVHQLSSSTKCWADPPDESKDRLDLDATPVVAAALLPLAREVAAACRRYQSRERQTKLSTARGHAGAQPANRHAPPGQLPELLADLALLQRLQQSVAKRPGQLVALEAHCDWALFDWASDCIFSAAEQGQLDLALVLYDAWDKLLLGHTTERLGTRPRLLLFGGRNKEALAAVQENLEREPESLDALEEAAHVYLRCGDLDAAEHYGRRYLAVARQRDPDLEERFAMETLAEILRERGDHQEATELEREAAELSRGDLDDEEEHWDDEPGHTCQICVVSAQPWSQQQPIVRTQHKIGRNQSCPCGSGAKYKKCCGG